MSKKLLYDVGINDAPYVTQRFEFRGEYYPNGSKKYKAIWKCPFYSRWKSMITRCYSGKNPTYSGCTVCQEWCTFSNFRKWMDSQSWEGKQLDKDLLVVGNKIYSPETCIFLHNKINTFLTSRSTKRNGYLTGVDWYSPMRKYRATIRITFIINKTKRYLGYYDSETEAHLAWKKRKHELACQLEDSEYVTDERVAEALRNRYKNYTTVEEHLL